jgi:DNA-binding transcriptional MocR family regulator
VSEVRTECVARQAIVAETLPAGSFRSNPEGYHLWIPLPGELAPAELIGALGSSGLSAASSEAFAADRTETSRGIRVSIGGSLSADRLPRALTLLDALLHHRGNRVAPMV